MSWKPWHRCPCSRSPISRMSVHPSPGRSSPISPVHCHPCPQRFPSPMYPVRTRRPDGLTVTIPRRLLFVRPTSYPYSTITSALFHCTLLGLAPPPSPTVPLLVL